MGISKQKKPIYPRGRIRSLRLSLHSPWQSYLFSLVLVTLATFVSIPIHFYIDPTNLVMIYLAIVVITAVFFGRGPSILAAFSSVVAFDFFLVDPRFSLDVTDYEYLISFFGLLAVGLVISSLTARVREQLTDLQRREVESSALYGLSRDLTRAGDLHEIASTINTCLDKTLDCQSIIYIEDGNQLKQIGNNIIGMETEGTITGKETAPEHRAAYWAFQHHAAAGRGTNRMPEAKLLFLPIQTSDGAVGVIGIAPRKTGSYLSDKQYHLLEGFVSLAALAFERARLAEQASQAELLKATERLQTALLNSISHDLRTPLATITGVLSSLRDGITNSNGLEMGKSVRLELLDSALAESDRLNRLVGNLLQMTRLEANAVRLSCEQNEIHDLIGTAIRQRKTMLDPYFLRVRIPQDLPMVEIDFVLMVQVLVNLLDNAVKYSEPGNEICIEAKSLVTKQVQICVLDRGIGVPPEDLENIFTRFYRISKTNRISGTGLGLSICKGIVEAHGGRIWAENRPEGGTSICFQIPVHQANEEKGK